MKFLQIILLIVAVMLCSSSLADAKKKHKHKYKSAQPSTTKTKTKTKWSTSTTDEAAPNGTKSMVATEEHGYYIKRTFLPLSGAATSTLRSPPYLGIPIAWFKCEGDACLKANTAAINSNSEGFLCEDDCTDPYEPACGKTTSEVAVFYNKCKLQVAKCRTHGLWLDIPYEQCKQTYPKEIEYTDKKFKLSPYFRAEVDTKSAESEEIIDIALEALNEINDKLEQAEMNAEDTDKDDDKDNENDKDAEKDKNTVNETVAEIQNEKVEEQATETKTDKTKVTQKPKENNTETEKIQVIEQHKDTKNVADAASGSGAGVYEDNVLIKDDTAKDDIDKAKVLDVITIKTY